MIRRKYNKMLILIILRLIGDLYFILYILCLFPKCLEISMLYFYNKKQYVIKIFLYNRIKAKHFVLDFFVLLYFHGFLLLFNEFY